MLFTALLPDPKSRGDNSQRGDVNGWRLTREKILMFCGLAIIGGEFINAELRGGTFHMEFLIVGLALCGISIAQWGDRGGR